MSNKLLLSEWPRDISHIKDYLRSFNALIILTDFKYMLHIITDKYIFEYNISIVGNILVQNFSEVSLIEMIF